MTTDDTYFERGINLRHGYPDRVLRRRRRVHREGARGACARSGVLLEPLTVVEKGIAQAYEIQRRLRVWRPRRAAVMGAGTIGLLATLVLRLRGPRGHDLRPHAEALPQRGADRGPRRALRVDGGRADPATARGSTGPFDLIFEATGYSPVVFDSMQALGKNGVLVLSSVTGGDRRVEVPADRINLEFVLGNKVMVGTVNANREYFELGVRDMAQAEAEYPGLARAAPHPPRQGARELPASCFDTLTTAKGAIKVFCEVADFA